MPSIRKILVPLDFSQCSDAAFEYALFLARRFDAALHLLHAWDWPPALPVGPAAAEVAPSGVPGNADEARAAIDGELVARLDRASAAGVQARGDVERGEPRAVILRVAAQDGCDLIVLGTHGRRGLVRLMLGSVAEEVVRRSPIPVLVVHHAGAR